MRASGDGVVMDVVNGKIAESARAGRKHERAAMSGMDRRNNTADHHHQMWSGLRPSRGLFADTSPESGRVRQQGLEASAADWAPTWARSSSSSMFACDDTKNTSSSPLQFGAASAAPVAPQWNYQPQGVWGAEATAAAAHYSTGLLDGHRQGWKRTESRPSDAENATVVEPARDHAPQAPLEPKPSRSPLPDTATVRDQLPRSSARAAPRWTSSYELASSSSSFGAASGDGALAAPIRLVSDAAGPSGAEQGLLLQPDSRRGWNWSQTGLPSSSRELSSPRRGLDQRLYRFNSSPCLDSKLDEEMTVFESQLTRTLSGYLSSRTSPPAKETSAPVVADAGDDAAASSAEQKPSGVSSVLKRKRADLADGDVQGESRWTQPLKLLVRKGLTLSDAGELGRIVLPKKDAESPPFPQIDTKEGKVLEMEDYKASKRWYFRFKYWINNRSRMYVLENTGDFIKYHCLKEHDIFIIFEDGCKKFVVRGLKLESGDPVLELSKGSMVENSTLQAPPPSTSEDEGCCNVISTVSTDTVVGCS